MLRTVHEKIAGVCFPAYGVHFSNLDGGLYFIVLVLGFFVLFVPFVDYAFLLGTCVTSVN